MSFRCMRRRGRGVGWGEGFREGCCPWHGSHGEERAYPLVDQGQPRERGPGEMRVDPHRHDRTLPPARSISGTEKPPVTSFRTRVLAEPPVL